MDPFDKIIGHESRKVILREIANTLKDPKWQGVSSKLPPKALLIWGAPGAGKTLTASCLIEASGRAAFTCRKTGPDDEFAKTIKDTFDRAVGAAPSIVFLDDIDKLADKYHEPIKAGIYNALVSCLDNLGDADVFVLMTASDRKCLPDSLRRRRGLGFGLPVWLDTEQIITHYLSGRDFSDDVNPTSLSFLLDGKSPADIKRVIEEAELIANHERGGKIAKDHFLQAYVRICCP